MIEPAQIVKPVLGTGSYTYDCAEPGRRYPVPLNYPDAATAEQAAAEHLASWHGGGNGSAAAPPGAGLVPGWRVVED